MNKFSLVLVLFLAAACTGEPRSVAEQSRHGTDSVAIDGYSPVSYFTDGKAERGTPDFAVPYDGLTYWLTDASQVELFNENPEHYAPAHRGWCSLMLTGSGNLAVANPESFKIVDDRLLLFWGGDFKGQLIDGRKNWDSKFADAVAETTLLGKADATWGRLLSGDKSENVVFFNPNDETRVNEARRLAGKKLYE